MPHGTNGDDRMRVQVEQRAVYAACRTLQIVDSEDVGFKAAGLPP